MKSKGKGGGVFAAVGAATGLGNAFRFPALCVKYGGVFIAAYLVSLVVICYPVLCAELSAAARKKRGWACIFRAAAVNSLIISLYYGLVAARLLLSATGNALPAPVCALGAAALMGLVLRGGSRALKISGGLSVCLSLALFSLLAAFGVAGGGVSFSVGAGTLLSGGLWADALGQALLALSLAAGVMPSFARTLPNGFSVRLTALKITAANFCGCILSALATMPHLNSFGGEGGFSVAFTVFPQVIASVAQGALLQAILAFVVYFTLTVVAVHSACSLALPALTLCKGRVKVFFPFAYCVLSLALAPVFALDGCAALNCCDRMACSVTAVAVAFSESAYFAWNGDIKGVNALFLPAVCLSLALFSVCGARFGGFPPYALALAAAAAVAPVAAALVPCAARKVAARKKSARQKL